MQKFGKGQSATRVEDRRFLTGQGRYIDDTAPDGAAHVVFLRAQAAHGVIVALDVTGARAMPGVHLVATAADLRTAGMRLDMNAERIKLGDGSLGAAPVRPLLADGKVRFAGEALAMIVADTIAQARDAAEAIAVEIDMMDAHLALAPGGPAVHDDVPDNLAFDYLAGDRAATDAAIAAAAHVVRVRVPDNRVIVVPIEPRGAWAEWDGARLHLATNGQGVWQPKKDIIRHLHLPDTAVRVTTPDVGGGFGLKGITHPEMVLVACAARMLGRPVRWMADRSESMLADNGGRDLVSDLTLAFDAGYRLTGYLVRTVSNLGAYNSGYGQMIQTELFSKVMTGTYAVPAAALQVKGVYTNTAPVDAYRGAGRPEAIFALERGMDHAARMLGLDPWELRRRNFIAPAAFPHQTPLGITYDCGEFARLLEVAQVQSDHAGFAARAAAARAHGRLRGMGLSYYIESILGDDDETARIVFTGDGMAELHVGTQSNGQGHETVYARFLADQTGLPMDRIRVMQGDSDLIPRGGGTGGSRSVTIQNTATLGTVDVMTRAFGGFLAGQAGLEPDSFGFDGDRFRAPGSNLTPTLAEAVDMARAAGRADLLDHTARTRLKGRSFPNGAHVAEVELDPETGALQVLRYTVVDDFGNLINPMLAEGQVHGGVVQGLGQVLAEQAVFDDQGQLLSASLMDYALPRAGDVPFIHFTSVPVPTRLNPLGMKGCGEAGTVGSLAAIANAVADALAQAGAALPPLPLTPQRLWAALHQVGEARVPG